MKRISPVIYVIYQELDDVCIILYRSRKHLCSFLDKNWGYGHLADGSVHCHLIYNKLEWDDFGIASASPPDLFVV